MQIYLPIAEMTVEGETIILLGSFVGFLSGVFGVGGGFLTTPFLIFIGIPPAIAVGTQASQLVAASVSGVVGHWRKGNVDTQVALVMLVGGIIGSVIGVSIFKVLQYFGQIDFTIAVVYIVLLGSIGGLMMVESVRTLAKKKNVSSEFNTSKIPPFIANLPYKMRFARSKLYVSALVPGGIGFVGGLLASTMGIGGGFLLVPAMIYILRMPTMLVAGTVLFQVIFTTAFATMMHAVFNQSVDIMLAVMLIIGGVIGAQFGVRVSRLIKGAHARIVLSVLLLTVCLQLAGQLFIHPAELYSTVVR